MASTRSLRTAIWLWSLLLAGCYAMQSSTGGGQTEYSPPRQIDPNDVVLPDGYRIEALASGLTFPTGVAFDDGGVYVVEAGYSYGEEFTTPRLLHIPPDGPPQVVATGGNTGPWTGVTFHDGRFYVAQGSQLEGGAILRIGRDGRIEPLVTGLPSLGDHHTNGPVVGPDGRLYFGQGTATNSGVVGVDNAKFGWLERFPDFHDIACRDITLTGENYESRDPLALDPGAVARTGAFVPFGTTTEPGQVVPGRIPCSGALMRIGLQGGEPELVAWGFRNPFGLAFAPDGTLYVTENSYDQRGSRPVFGTGDVLWRVQEGAWYGWPDYHGDHKLYEGDRYAPYGEDPPKRLLADHPGTPPHPVAYFAVHSSSDGFDFSRSPDFGHRGEAFVAQFGDEAPATGKVLDPVGFRVVRVDVETGVVTPFAVNRQGNGPASFLNGGGLERPVAARFDPAGRALYVVDFGVLLQHDQGAIPKKNTGVLWRISRGGER